MKNKALIVFVIIISLIMGGMIGWWANSPANDILCSEPYVSELTEDVEAESAIIRAGTKVNLRSCEYAERFTISFYYPKNPEQPIFIPINSAPNFGNHGAEQYEVKKLTR